MHMYALLSAVMVQTNDFRKVLEVAKAEKEREDYASLFRLAEQTRKTLAAAKRPLK